MPHRLDVVHLLAGRQLRLGNHDHRAIGLNHAQHQAGYAAQPADTAHVEIGEDAHGRHT
jgi:hypothetical protein